jgi:hypothetical protein
MNQFKNFTLILFILKKVIFNIILEHDSNILLIKIQIL